MHMSKEPATHSREGDFLKVIPTHLYIHRSTYTPKFRDRAQHTPTGQLTATLVQFTLFLSERACCSAFDGNV